MDKVILIVIDQQQNHYTHVMMPAKQYIRCIMQATIRDNINGIHTLAM